MASLASRGPKSADKKPSIELGTKGQQYEPQKELGRGNFGVAFLVTLRANASTALVMKCIELDHMDDEAKAKAQNECKVLTELAGGPYIVGVVEYFVELERLWIVMDFADGGDLAARIKAQKAAGVPFTEDEVVDWIVQLVLALSHAHERKVLHRDLKPQNIFLMRDGAVRLGDFGISRVLSSTLSVVNTCIGTPLYLSPEAWNGSGYDDKSDAWSLGVLLYELCALRRPFEANELPAAVCKICRDEAPPLPPPYSEPLRTIAGRLLTKEPAGRPRVRELLEEPVFAPRVAPLQAAWQESQRAVAQLRRSSNSGGSGSSGGGMAARPRTSDGGVGSAPAVLQRFASAPLVEYPNLSFDSYRARSDFHRINLEYPGVQLVNESPYIFLIPGFMSESECQALIAKHASSEKVMPSATSAGQEGKRTSTSLILPPADCALIRERVATLTSIPVDHMDPTKLTRYGEGEFFARHMDTAMVLTKRKLRCWKAVTTQPGPGEAAATFDAAFGKTGLDRTPERLCSTFIYLNDVARGGRTTFCDVDGDSGHADPVAPAPCIDKFSRDLDAVRAGRAIEPATPGSAAARALSITPRAGMAVVHFPATTAEYLCMPDYSTYHEAEPAISPKYIVQQFIWSSPRDQVASAWATHIQHFRALALDGEQSSGSKDGALYIDATQKVKYMSLSELQAVAGSSRILEMLHDVTEGDQNSIPVVERETKGCWMVWAFRRSGDRSPMSEKERCAMAGIYVEPAFFSEGTPLAEARALLSDAADAASKLKDLVIQSIW